MVKDPIKYEMDFLLLFIELLKGLKLHELKVGDGIFSNVFLPFSLSRDHLISRVVCLALNRGLLM